MAYKCVECGHIFEEGEQIRWDEDRGEFWGSSCSETMSGCPRCGGFYEETKSCEICGSEHLENELLNGVCEDCIDEYKNDANMCYKIGETDKDNIKLNSFLTAMFDVEEIEKILFKELVKNTDKIDCSDFINVDRSWFAERLAEEVKKDENAKG